MSMEENALLSITELARARERTAALLDELRLEAYLFDIQPGASEEWTIKIECVVNADGAWETASLNVTKEDLLASADDTSRGRLLTEWGKQIACKKRIQERLR